MKKVVCLLLVFALAISTILSGCGKKSGTTEKEKDNIVSSQDGNTNEDNSSETNSQDDENDDFNNSFESLENTDDGIMRFEKLIKPIIQPTKPDSGAFAPGKTLKSSKGKMTDISFVTDTKATNKKMEIKMNIKDLPADINVFRSDELDLSIELTSSTGKKILMPGFYYQDYAYLPTGQQYGENGNPDFRLRFTLTEEGTWDFVIKLSLNGKEVDAAKGYINALRNEDTRGFLSVEPVRKQNFVFEDNTPYVVIGENICTSTELDSKKSIDIISKMEKAAEYGANFSRLWTYNWSLPIQTATKAPDDFTDGLANASQIDKIFEAASKNDMYICFTLFSFNSFTTMIEGESGWDTTAYNKKLVNGYLDTPDQFFTNEQAIEDTKVYLRYLVARYGYSRNLMAWELFNEADLCECDGDLIREWHIKMVDYIKSIDPYKHMVTTSTAQKDDILNHNMMFDFVSLHWYNYGELKNVSTTQKNLWQIYKKPVIFGEIGLNRNVSAYIDSDLINFHQQNWAGLMGGGGGTAANWFWNDLDKVSGYWDYKIVSEMAEHIPWYDTSMFMVGTSNVSPDNNQVEVLGYRGQTYAYLWLYDNLFSHMNKSVTDFENIELTIRLKDGKYHVRWINTWTGVSLGKSIETAVDGELVIKTPKWSKDVAVAITRD